MYVCIKIGSVEPPFQHTMMAHTVSGVNILGFCLVEPKREYGMGSSLANEDGLLDLQKRQAFNLWHKFSQAKENCFFT